MHLQFRILLVWRQLSRLYNRRDAWLHRLCRRDNLHKLRLKRNVSVIWFIMYLHFGILPHRWYLLIVQRQYDWVPEL